MPTSTSVRLARRPVGMPVADDFRISSDEIPEPGPGQVLVRVTMISLDPAMRGWLDDRPSYLPPIAIDEVIRAGAVGEVVESHHPKFPVGTARAGRLRRAGVRRVGRHRARRAWIRRSARRRCTSACSA